MRHEPAAGGPPTAPAAVSVSPVRFEHFDHAFGIGTATPRLSWQVSTQDERWQQKAYELDCAGELVLKQSGEQVLVPWPFGALGSRSQATVRVRVTDGHTWSGWSEPSTVETGLLERSDWRALFITPATIGRTPDPAPILTKTVRIERDLSSARLYATAYGYYLTEINGERASEDLFTPGWTSYQHNLRYQTYDVTSLLRKGVNELRFLLGNGWYRGRIKFRAPHADRLALLAQLELLYTDGSRETIATDTSWSATDSGVLGNDLYDGQRTDLRPGDSRTDKVEIVDLDLTKVTAGEAPPVRITGTVPAKRIWRSPSGKTLVDFGQNIAGWVRLEVQDPALGQEVSVRHAEVLEGGELGTRPLLDARATDTYILDGSSHATLQPSLTYHGFRYAEISGMPGVDIQDVVAVVVGSDLRRTGWFTCSDGDLNQLYDNIIWGMRANFFSVPTDCPQRNERLGWTGDIQVFCPTATFLFDIAGFLGSWLTDLAADQYADGSVPFVIPDVLRIKFPAAAGWGDAATFVPWTLYQRYGDIDILRRQYPSMRAWVDKMSSLTSNRLWVGGFQWGDWLDPTAPPDDPFAAQTDPAIVATAYLVRSAEIVAESARLLGKQPEADRYSALAAETREAFADEYVTSSGRMLSDTPTAYALALEWGLIPTARQQEKAKARLADLVRANGFRVSTGFLGTPLITDALCTAGKADLAYRLLLERSCPSWLYPVTMGATTVWERWDSMLPDGRINPGEMTSFNHYAFGAVADWMHRVVAGLAPAAPGYRVLEVKPAPFADLRHAEARLDTPYGEAAVSWERANGRFQLDLVVPVGAEADVSVPGATPIRVGHGSHSWSVADPCANGPRRIVTVRDLIDSSEVWAKTTTLLIEHGYGESPAELAISSAPYLDLPARDLPLFLAQKKSLISGDGEEARTALEAILP